jgi:hypothetical protein
MMKPYLIYIAAVLLALFLATPVRAQNTDSITVISSPSVKEDTNIRTAPVPSRIKPARPDNFWRRVSLGGWLSFQFGSITGISVSPEVKVRTVNQLWVGLGLTYQYSHFKDWYYNTATKETEDFSSNTVGGRIFLRYYLSGLVNNFLGNIFVHTEYEYLSYIRPYTYAPQQLTNYYLDPYGNKYVKGNSVIEINSIFIGGGYRQPISDRAFFDLMILFNLNDTPYSPYTNPIFRFGFGMGL